MERFDPDAVDLAALARTLMDGCGPSVAGSVVGRTRLRDEVVRSLGCSLLEAEQLVDTMIGRGFLHKEVDPEGFITWRIVRDAA
jgi:hypothetical protein